MAIRRKIAAVSYLNTVPFVYGIKHAGFLHADLLLAPPADCVKNFLDSDCLVALLPVGALPSLTTDYKIITSYCIGASRSVRTVGLFSRVPIDQVKRIMLDSHSRTSVVLTKILCAELWKINPEWGELSDLSLVDPTDSQTAFLLIGDKVFDYENLFPYRYDLADCWRELTSMPMVFAVWVARKDCPPEVEDDLQLSLTFGLERTWEAIVEEGYSSKDYAYEYLTENIDFLFDNQKYKALEKFWEKGLKYIPHAKPG